MTKRAAIKMSHVYEIIMSLHPALHITTFAFFFQEQSRHTSSYQIYRRTWVFADCTEQTSDNLQMPFFMNQANTFGHIWQKNPFNLSDVNLKSSIVTRYNQKYHHDHVRYINEDKEGPLISLSFDTRVDQDTQ